MISQISGLRFPLPETRLLLHKKRLLTDTFLPQYLTNFRAFKIKDLLARNESKSMISGFDKEKKNDCNNVEQFRFTRHCREF